MRCDGCGENGDVCDENGDGCGEYDVVVIGDLFCDISTNPLRGYPAKDKQEACDFMLSLGGQAGNCAAACGALGLRTAFICKCGDDPISHWLLAFLRNNGVECFSSVKMGGKPGITVSIVFDDGSRSMLSDRGANMELCSDDIDLSLVERARFVMRAGHWNTECLFDANRMILEHAKASGAFTGVDIGWSAYKGWTEEAKKSVFDILPFTDFLFVNEAELDALCSSQQQRHSTQQQRPRRTDSERNKSGINVENVNEIISRGGSNVIIHRGSEGSAWISEEIEVFCQAFEVPIVNPTGAGDVFNAAFICAFLAGESPESCLKFANACAAVFLSMRNREKYPTIDDVRKFLMR